MHPLPIWTEVKVTQPIEVIESRSGGQTVDGIPRKIEMNQFCQIQNGRRKEFEFVPGQIQPLQMAFSTSKGRIRQNFEAGIGHADRFDLNLETGRVLSRLSLFKLTWKDIWTQKQW